MNTAGETLLEELASVVMPNAKSEWTAAALRPVAHWILMPGSDGRNRLRMVWETPDPIPPTPTTA
jgi:hypothetical protein